MRILIVGAGKTGAFLAEKLHDRPRDHGHRAAAATGSSCVRSMVPDVDVVARRRVRAGGARAPRACQDVDLVAAVTGDDEDNLVVTMLAKLYDAKAVYARVNHPRNEWLFDKEWGVDVAVSSPQVLYGLIEKDLGFGDLITLLKLKADGVYLEEITLPESAQQDRQDACRRSGCRRT